ncbi:MAG: ABC exporter membrane fusion protein [Crocosphaera sp.]
MTDRESGEEGMLGNFGESLTSEKAQPTTKSRLLWIVALSGWGILLVGGGIFYQLDTIKPSLPQSSSLAAQEEAMPSRVAALGYLEPKGEIIKVSAPAFLEGARVTQLLVQRGDRVIAGQTIAILDNHDRLKAALEQAKTKVQVAQANLEKVKAGAKQGDIKAQNARFIGTKAELEGQISVQHSTISNLESQLLGERTAQQATIKRLKAELANNTTDCQRYQTLHDNGAVSAQEYDRVCLQQEITQQQLQEAQANLQRIVNTLRAQINAAQANLTRTRATLNTQIAENQAMLIAVAEVRPVDIQVAQSELISAKAAVKQAEADLALAYVKAPSSGQILKVHTRPGEIVDNEGIVELGETSQMYVTAEVYESDLTRIQKGQSAIITTNSVTEKLQGTVEEIGLQVDRQRVMGTDATADVDARVVEVKVRLNPEDSQQVAQLTNLQVNVIINTTEQQ